jgi:PTS system ascorbate-specific IIA component
LQIVAKENIRLGVRAAGWEEAIREAGRLLLQSGQIREAYIDHMIQSVKTLGPYIVIIPGVAIAHARPDETVLAEGVSVITLEKAVAFGNPDNDPVDIVWAFAARSNNGHLETIARLSRFLENDRDLALLRQASDADFAYRLINRTAQP